MLGAIARIMPAGLPRVVNGRDFNYRFPLFGPPRTRPPTASVICWPTYGSGSCWPVCSPASSSVGQRARWPG
eukprot:5323028-Lingulodinium_polyedra.AAC.1